MCRHRVSGDPQRIQLHASVLFIKTVMFCRQFEIRGYISRKTAKWRYRFEYSADLLGVCGEGSGWVGGWVSGWGLDLRVPQGVDAFPSHPFVFFQSTAINYAHFWPQLRANKSPSPFHSRDRPSSATTGRSEKRKSAPLLTTSPLYEVTGPPFLTPHPPLICEGNPIAEKLKSARKIRRRNLFTYFHRLVNCLRTRRFI